MTTGASTSCWSHGSKPCLRQPAARHEPVCAGQAGETTGTEPNHPRDISPDHGTALPQHLAATCESGQGAGGRPDPGAGQRYWGRCRPAISSTNRVTTPRASSQTARGERARTVPASFSMASSAVAFLFSYESPQVKNLLRTWRNKRLTYGQQPDGPVLIQQPQQQPRRPAAVAFQRRIPGQKPARIALRHRHQRRLPFQIGDAEARQA